jgi:cytidylate kinase
MAVITISRQFGSGGDAIAERICEITGYRRFDKHVITKTAVESGLSNEEVIDYSEDNYKTQNFLDRLLGRTRPVAQVRVWTENPDGVRKVEDKPISEENALSLVRLAVETAYKEGNIVIIGRGGQVILKDRPGVLHVRIEAPLEVRLQRVRSEPQLIGRTYGISYQDRRAAQDLTEANDAVSADYLKRFYNVDWADLDLYHLIINTDKLNIEQAARLIVATAQQIEVAIEHA